MKASDLSLIASVAELHPRLLPHMISIYKLGYKQATIDQLDKQLKSNEVYGINYGREMLPNN
jgi:hypothetical protein